VIGGEKASGILLVVLVALVLDLVTFFSPFTQRAHATDDTLPTISDPNLKVELVTKGLPYNPTSMAFLNDSNILVLSKQSGQVHLVTKGILQEQPVLEVLVNRFGERGLLGIVISDHHNGIADVFLYHTEADPLRNRVYKYEWNKETLINPSLILDLPAEPATVHNGGKIIIGPDGYLYTVIGDLITYIHGSFSTSKPGELQNSREGSPPDDTGVIVRVNPEDGSAAPGNPFARSGDVSLSKYYAYGIRNSFGMDFDPLTGNLWDTENGEAIYDEINLVKPGFNSGWSDIIGPSTFPFSEDELVKFPGSHYADPVLSWLDTVGLTDIEFYTSSELGDRYRNNIFVGDINNSNLYFFEVNETRNGLELGAPNQESGLSDLVVDTEDDLSSVTFGTGFGSITDIETGPDGFLYILSLSDGAIYKISPVQC
jgi:glucose/arabinose dehydrogenase